MHNARLILCLCASIGAVLTGSSLPRQPYKSPCFNRNYSVAAQAHASDYTCVSVPECRCDDCPGGVEVYRQRVLQYRFEVPHIGNQLYLVTPNGAVVVELSLEKSNVVLSSSPAQAPQQDDTETGSQIRFFSQEKWQSNWQLPSALRFERNVAQRYSGVMRSLGRRLYLDDSCLYLRRSGAFLRLNLLTHAMTKLPLDSGKRHIKLKVLD